MQSICIPSEVVAHQVVAFPENIEHALALLTKARGGIQLDFEHPPTRNQGPSGHVEVVSMAFQNGIICIAFRWWLHSPRLSVRRWLAALNTSRWLMGYHLQL